jgi:GH24 family phage-related lysozyme (muramidase)
MEKHYMQNVIPNFTLWAQMIQEFEGFKENAYHRKGDVPTVGFGSTYNYTAKRKVKLGDVVTLQEATNWMQFDFQETIRLANVYIHKPLNKFQATAICDYIYNRGIGNFLKTQLDEMINENPSNPKILDEIRGTGLKDKLGNLLRGLVRRRKSQAHLYSTGVINFFR